MFKPKLVFFAEVTPSVGCSLSCSVWTLASDTEISIARRKI